MRSQMFCKHGMVLNGMICHEFFSGFHLLSTTFFYLSIHNSLLVLLNTPSSFKSLFGSAVKHAFDQILIYFVAKIECGLYFWIVLMY
jgi:hypothetical protein